MSQPAQKPLFPLVVKIDPDSIEWTHLVGVLGFTMTPEELPAKLYQKLLPILRWIESYVRHEFVLHQHDLIEAPENAANVLHLTAWWLEWKRRHKNARGSFNCTHCKNQVEVKIGSCSNNACPTWELLRLVHGHTVLHVVKSSKSA